MVLSRHVVFVLLAGVGLLCPAALLGQAGPFTGAGELKLSTNLKSIPAGDRVEVQLDVDLTFVAAIRPEDALTKGSRTVLLAPSDLTATRFNVGVRMLSDGATIRITVADRDGRVMASASRTYPANFFDQQSGDSLAGLTLSGSESLTIELESGSAII